MDACTERVAGHYSCLRALHEGEYGADFLPLVSWPDLSPTSRRQECDMAQLVRWDAAGTWYFDCAGWESDLSP